MLKTIKMTENTRKKVRREKDSTETRKAGAILGLGPKISNIDSEIAGARLPTNEQVIWCC